MRTQLISCNELRVPLSLLISHFSAVWEGKSLPEALRDGSQDWMPYSGEESPEKLVSYSESGQNIVVGVDASAFCDWRG